MEHFVPAGSQLSECCGGDGFVWGSAVGCRWWDTVVWGGGTWGWQQLPLSPVLWGMGEHAAMGLLIYQLFLGAGRKDNPH